MAHRVVYRPSAEGDLKDIHDYIAEDNPRRALSYVQEIRARCDRLASLPMIGTVRSEIAPGLRVIGFRRRVAIAFQVSGDEVVVLRILYGGRDLAAAFPDLVDE